jgi:murein DD-endopeptidase MepM/ murein hydrolase activator NlpD
MPTHDRGKRDDVSYDCTQAVDLKCKIGTPANAMRGGRVSYIHLMEDEKTWRSLDKPPEGYFKHPLDVYGNFLVIAHEDGPKGERSLYGHMSEILVKVGDAVSKGDIIGYTGETGQSLKPHIHNEVGYWKDKNTWITRKIRWAGDD